MDVLAQLFNVIMDGWMDGVSNIKGLYNLILLTTKSHVLTNRITDDFSSFPIKRTVSNLFNLINAFSFLRSSTSTLENVTQSVVSRSFYGTSWCWQEVSSPRNKRLASYLSAHCYITFVCFIRVISTFWHVYLIWFIACTWADFPQADLGTKSNKRPFRRH